MNKRRRLGDRPPKAVPPAKLDSMPDGAIPCPGCKSWVYLRTMPGGSTLRHLRYVGEVLVRGPGSSTVLEAAYALHRCDLLDMWLEQQSRKKSEVDAHLREQRRMSAQEERLAMLEAAGQYDCIKCGAEAGDPCMNLVKRKDGEEVPTRNPHVERQFLVWRAQDDAAKANNYQAAYERERQRAEIVKLAQAVQCPSCAAATGDPCMNLTERTQGRSVAIRYPHAARQVAAGIGTD